MDQPANGLKLKILVAPLDWGLGHATRCIPLIRELREQGCAPLIGASGATRRLLQAEFPHLEVLPLPGYDVRYARSRPGLCWTMGVQIPKILSRIQQENHLLARFVKERGIDAVISDNRYGLYHPSVPTVIITHQLRIRTGMGTLADRLLQRLHYRFLRRFRECWVPDSAEGEGLAAALSHPLHLPPLPLHYLGPLTRFRPGRETSRGTLVMLSGPEPQRSLLEECLLPQLGAAPPPVTLVRGLPGQTGSLDAGPGVRVFNHLGAADLERELHAAEWVVARSGYSTVMDLAALGKKSLLIPTPGQTEQEYLARHLATYKWAFPLDQDQLNLANAFQLAAGFAYVPWPGTGSALSEVVGQWLQRVQATRQR